MKTAVARPTTDIAITPMASPPKNNRLGPSGSADGLLPESLAAARSRMAHPPYNCCPPAYPAQATTVRRAERGVADCLDWPASCNRQVSVNGEQTPSARRQVSALNPKK